MKKSILQENPNQCILCGRMDRPLDRHHVFGAANRKKSEKYGLFVWLCHDECHIFGPNAVHNNRVADIELKQYAQATAMDHYEWTTDEWIALFGRNYL